MTGAGRPAADSEPHELLSAEPTLAIAPWRPFKSVVWAPTLQRIRWLDLRLGNLGHGQKTVIDPRRRSPHDRSVPKVLPTFTAREAPSASDGAGTSEGAANDTSG